MSALDQQISDISRYIAQPRFKGIVRLYSARQVAEQRGRIAPDYAVARTCAEAFYNRLRELFAAGKSITTFGPYSPGQAVNIKRMGIEGIYLGGWATSAKGSITEDPGADLASYPLNQVPDEASAIVRALLTADKNQQFARSRMTDEQRAATPEVDYRPFIIADADTGHGGDAHVRNLIRRFVEVGVTGYHIEDQKPGVKKCGHQGGKVLVAEQEQIMRLNAARFQLDIMGVPGIIVARTDAEAANLLDGCGDERDQPFLLGSTNTGVPTYRAATFAMMRRIFALGVEDINGHQMVKLSDEEYAAADEWLKKTGLMASLEADVKAYKDNKGTNAEALLDKITNRFVDIWQNEAGIKTFGQAVADVITFRKSQGESFAMTVEQWLAFAKKASLFAAKAKAASLGISITWDAEHAKTPDGYYQVRDGLHYAIAKSLAAAPFADILWMETATANLAEAREFAEAIHAEYPEKMLAYNLSPSFNWDTTGMTDEQMKRFPEELGKLGFVFNFITYGGHQVDGLASEEFATALKQDGMLALARLQRKLRLLESPYKTPQTLVGGPRLDAALVASSGRTATTKAMGAGSTQHQHLVPIETPPSVLQEWLKLWAEKNKVAGAIKVRLRPVTPGSDVLELGVLGDKGEKLASVVFSEIQDRKGQRMLLVRDQHTEPAYRNKRLMMLAHLFLIHRYKVSAVHYVSPTDDNRSQADKMKKAGMFSAVSTEVGQIIVADVNAARITELLGSDKVALGKLITKG